MNEMLTIKAVCKFSGLGEAAIRLALRVRKGKAMSSVLMRRQEVEELCNLKRSVIYRMIRDGKFPQPLKISGGARGAVRWRRDEIENWIKSLPRATGVRGA